MGDHTKEFVLFNVTFAEWVEVLQVLLEAKPIDSSQPLNIAEYPMDVVWNPPCSSAPFELLLSLCHVIEVERPGVIEEIHISNFFSIFRSIHLAYNSKLLLVEQEIIGSQHLPELFG